MLASSSVAVALSTLPRLSANEAQAQSLIARHGADLAVTLTAPVQNDGTPMKWRLAFSLGAPQGLADAADLSADLEWSGARMRLRLPAGAVSAWLQASLPELSIDDLPEPLLATAVETLLADVCGALAGVSPGGAPRVSALPASGGPLPHSWTLVAHHEESGHTAYALLECDGLGLMLLAGLLQRVAPAPNGVEVDSVAVLVRAVLGWTDIPAGELANLRRRDTLFIDHYQVTSEGELWLAVGSQGLRVRREAASYVVTQGWTSVMNDTQRPPGGKSHQPAPHLMSMPCLYD
jgi:type III secretion protein Q